MDDQEVIISAETIERLYELAELNLREGMFHKNILLQSEEVRMALYCIWDDLGLVY
tara:strand:+ start:5009 stop:5176 length:168 start_codon:yes stop_codon:yes gene_type:complete